MLFIFPDLKNGASEELQDEDVYGQAYAHGDLLQQELIGHEVAQQRVESEENKQQHKQERSAFFVNGHDGSG
jgi:hypothetical protein